MAKMTAEDAKAFLKTDVGFTDEQLTGMNAAQLNKLAESVMRQSDYDRSMNEGKAELKKAQDDLAAANEKLNAELADWATLQAAGGDATRKMQQDLERARAQVAMLSTRVTTYAQQAGVDPKVAMDGLETVVVPDPKQPPTNQPDLSGYVKADDFNRNFGQLANMAVSLPAELYALATEHQELFGKPLDTREIVKELQTRAGTRNNQKPLEPRAIWEETHKVAEARQAKADAKHAADIKAAEERGRQAAISESAIPGQATSTGRHAAIFGSAERKSALQRPQPGQTVNAAVTALRSGKYRQEPGKKSA